MNKLIHPSLSACLLAGLLGFAAASANAKLPALSPEAKVKADEAAAKTAWAGKVDAFQLCRSQDKVAAAYHGAAKAGGLPIKPPVATPPCSDPGAYVAISANPPKPIEASGAHSPAETAASPPSTTQTHSTMAPAAKKP